MMLGLVTAGMNRGILMKSGMVSTATVSATATATATGTATATRTATGTGMAKMAMAKMAMATMAMATMVMVTKIRRRSSSVDALPALRGLGRSRLTRGPVLGIRQEMIR